MKNLCLVPFSFDWISYTHMVNITDCGAYFKYADISGSFRSKRKHLNLHLNVGRLVFEFLPFYFPTTHTKRRGCGKRFSPTRMYFVLVVSVTHTRTSSLNDTGWESCHRHAHVFVILITKYVAIYALSYIYARHVFMLALPENCSGL